MANRKVNMGQDIKTLGGESLRINQTLHQDTVITFVRALSKVSEKDRKVFDDALEEAAGAPITLTRIVCDSLLSPAADEVATEPKMSRADRLTLALRLNRTGMCRISDEDVKKIMPHVEKCYKGALIAPQVEMLLKGENFISETVNEDEPEET